MKYERIEDSSVAYNLYRLKNLAILTVRGKFLAIPLASSYS